MKQPIVLQGREASLLELAVFTELGRGPLSAAVLTQRLSLQPCSAQQLFDGLVVLGLLEQHGVLYGNIWEVDRLLEPLSEISRHRGSRQFLLTIAGVLALLFAFGAFQQWAAPRPQSFPTQVVSSKSVLPSRADFKPAVVIPEESYLYYLVSTQQHADAVDTLLQAVKWGAGPLRGAAPDHTVVVVASPEREAQLHQTIDDANRQMEADSENIRFRIVDLRSPK